MNVAW